jgi:hypothetical protein
MPRLLVACYSQSGQTARAAKAYVSAFVAANPDTRVDEINLGQVMPSAARYPLPWSFFRFVRAQPESFFARAEPALGPAPDFKAYDAVVIAYPVWFLSPAAPVTSWLLGLPPGSLADRPVVTLSTCRKMWYRAQAVMRSLVEAKGGRVVSHVSLQDPGGQFTSLLATPYFFLTSRRRSRLLPEFGIRDAQYAELTRRLSEPGGGLGRLANHYRFSPGVVLAEVVGVRISRSLYLFWGLAQRAGGVGEKAYLLGVALVTVVAIALLLPLTLLLGRLPPLRGKLCRLERNVVSGPPA